MRQGAGGGDGVVYVGGDRRGGKRENRQRHDEHEQHKGDGVIEIAPVGRDPDRGGADAVNRRRADRRRERVDRTPESGTGRGIEGVAVRRIEHGNDRRRHFLGQAAGPSCGVTQQAGSIFAVGC